MTFWSTLLRARVAKMRFWSTPFRARVAKEEANQKPTRGIEFLDPPGVAFEEPVWSKIHKTYNRKIIEKSATKKYRKLCQKASKMEQKSMPKLIKNQCKK